MSALLASRTFEYVFAFTATGLVVVLVKALGDLSNARLAGLAATLPVKIFAAWLIVSARFGSEGIRSSTTGMAIGLFGIACMVVVVRVASTSVRPGVAIALGFMTWVVVAGWLGYLLAPPPGD